MKRLFGAGLILLMAAVGINQVCALSESLRQPKLFLPKGYNVERAEAVQAVLASEKFNYVDGMTSYWPERWPTTLVYEGNSEALSEFVFALNRVEGITVRLTFSPDLAKETGSALRAGCWWVKYSHTEPNVITVRINLAAEQLGREKFELQLRKFS